MKKSEGAIRFDTMYKSIFFLTIFLLSVKITIISYGLPKDTKISELSLAHPLDVFISFIIISLVHGFIAMLLTEKRNIVFGRFKNKKCVQIIHNLETGYLKLVHCEKNTQTHVDDIAFSVLRIPTLVTIGCFIPDKFSFLTTAVCWIVFFFVMRIVNTFGDTNCEIKDPYSVPLKPIKYIHEHNKLPNKD